MSGRLVPLELGLAIACIGICLAIALSGGGRDTRPLITATAAPIWLNRVTAVDIARTPTGSPGRSLLKWFRAVQLREVKAVRSLTAPPSVSHVSTSHLDRAVNRIGTGLAHPDLISTRVVGNQATVRVRLLTYLPNGRRPISDLPAIFALTRLNGAWVVSNVSVLLRGASRS